MTSDLNTTSSISNVTTSQNALLTIDDLAPNNYLTIVWRSPTTNQTYNTFDEMSETAKQYTIELNNAVNQALASTNKYSAQLKNINLESIAKYVTQNTISNGTQRKVINGLIGLISKSGTETLQNQDDITNLMVNVFGTIANKVAQKTGLSDPHEVFANIMNENNLKVLCDKTHSFIENIKNKFSKTKSVDSLSSIDTKSTKTYSGLLLGLTTSDTESIDVTIPRRTVEDGSNYTTHLLPQPFRKDFEVTLTNKILDENYSSITEIENIEKIKDKLFEIANSRTPFDIYIKLSNNTMYKRSQVVFSSLSITKSPEAGNGYSASFTIEPITNFNTKTFISNKKFTAKKSSSGTSSSKSGSGKSNTNNSGANSGSKGKNNKDQLANGNGIKYGIYNGTTVYNSKSLADLKTYASQNGYALAQVAKNNKISYVLIPPSKIAYDSNRKWYYIKDGTLQLYHYTYKTYTAKTNTRIYDKTVLSTSGWITANNLTYKIIYAGRKTTTTNGPSISAN